MRYAVALLLVVGVAACKSGGDARRLAAERPRPGMASRVDASLAAPLHFGSSWPAELAQVTTLGVDDCLRVRARFVLMQGPPDVPLASPLDHRVRAVVEPTTGEAHLAPVLAAGGLFLDRKALGTVALPRGELLADLAGALPAEVTLRVGCYTERPEAAPILSTIPAPLVTERLAILVRRHCVRAPTRHREAAFELEISAELASFGSPTPAPEPVVETAPEEKAVPRRLVHKLYASGRAAARERSELIELRPERAPEDLAFAIAVPSPFERVPGWIVAVIEVAPPPLVQDPGYNLHERCVRDVAAQIAAERARFSKAGEPDLPAWTQAPVDRPKPDLGALREEMKTWPRRGLARLAQDVGAMVALDAALELDGPALVEVATEVERALARRAAREVHGLIVEGVMGVSLCALRTLRWEIDQAAIRALLRVENRKAARPVLERRFGAAFAPDTSGAGRGLLPRLRAVRSHEELEHLVIERNLLALEDTRPGVRIVASRWLRRLVPGLAGYDPFGPFEERRVAVDRLWQLLVPEETP